MPLETFQKLLIYFYTGGLTGLTLTDCSWILSCADIYHLHEATKLIQYAVKVIETGISEINWAEALHLSIISENDMVEKKALSVMPETTDPETVVTLLLSVIKDQTEILNRNQDVSEV